MKFKYFTILITFTILLLYATGCNKIENEDLTTTDIHQVYGSNNDNQNNDSNEDFIIPSLEERTDWNIELSFVECNDIGIKINIYDYDNQGFAFNDLYFVLEVYEDDEWLKISKLNENAANRDLGYVVPSKTKDFIDFPSMNRFAFLPDVTLETGHYRLTKILSGRAFSVEFDLVID